MISFSRIFDKFLKSDMRKIQQKSKKREQEEREEALRQFKKALAESNKQG